MPKYTLKYFNVKGLGEPIRYLFAWSDVEFSDVRIDRDNWPTLKAAQPFGQLPVLDTGDALLVQSAAIARYLGKTFGLSVDDDLKNARLDGLVDYMNDIVAKQYVVMNTGVGGEELLSTVIPFYFKKFEAIASEGWFYGSNPTWADIYFVGFIDTLETRLNTEILAAYPKLSQIKKKVSEKPSVKKYLDNRPFCVR